MRYALYGEWRDSTCNFGGRNCCPVASHAADENTREIKKALSRVTASQSTLTGPGSTDRGPARALAKLSHTNPCALWATAVTQVKAYPNIGQFIVEAGRYMTQLSMDVATFTLVDTLSDDNISRLNPTGTDVAQWLSSAFQSAKSASLTSHRPGDIYWRFQPALCQYGLGANPPIHHQPIDAQRIGRPQYP